MNKYINYLYNHSIKLIISSFFYTIYKFKKINPKSALFVSHPDLTDNTFPLFLELKNKGFKCTWILYKKESIETAKKLGADVILFSDIRSYKSILKFAKYHYLFTSHDIPNWYWKKGQIVYNCWHGSPFKKYRGRYLNNFKKQHYLIAPSSYCLDLYCKTYDRKIYKERCLAYRHFRTDYFMKNYGLKEKQEAYNFLNLKNYSKMIVCCLTWSRDTNYKENQINNLLGLKLNDNEFEQLNEKLKQNKTLLLIKPHPAYEKSINFNRYSNIRVITSDDLANNNIQLYAILALSNALLTDFSSILFDYCLLDNPVGHILHDMNYYLENEKEKFIYDNPTEFMYGFKIKIFDDLLKFVTLNFKQENSKREKIAKLYNFDYNVRYSSTTKFIDDNILI